MSKFLKLRHWQLFILLFGIPMILEMIIIGVVITSRSPDAAFLFFPIMMVLVIGLFFSWYYALGTNLYKRLPITVSMRLTRFRLFLFIPAVYMILLMVFMANAFTNIASGGQPAIGFFAVIFPLHLFSMFCMGYTLYFVSKALKSIELQRPVTFSDYAGEFFLFWFFPVGIWILQPRINRLFESAPDDAGDSLFEGYQG